MHLSLLQTTLFLLLCRGLSVLAFLEEAVPDDNLQFHASVTDIDGSVPLTLTCTFKLTDHPSVVTLNRLQLSRRSPKGTDYTTLVTVTPIEAKNENGFNGVSSGHIDAEDKVAILTATYTQPTADERGEYVCSSLSFDSDANEVQSVKRLTIRSGTADTDELLKCMSGKSRQSLSGLENSLVSCGANRNNWFDSLRAMTSLALENHGSVFAVTEVFNAESYYIISQNGVDPKQFSYTFCKNQNGYLVEFNTESEFLFLHNALKELYKKHSSSLPFRSLVTGAHYLTNYGDFEFHTHYGKSYTGHWLPGEPHKEKTAWRTNWLLLIDQNRNGDFGMADGKSIHTSTQAFICEVSKTAAQERARGY